MFGQITDLPYLSNYAEAVAHYESIVPIRGNADNVRPICATKNGRRKKHMAIRKYVDGSVACRLYDTDVVTFYRDGDVSFYNGNYPTATTHGFANAILGAGVWFANRQCRTEALLDNGNTYILDGADSLMLRKNSEGKYEAVNPPAQYEYYARRKVLTDKRRPVLEFQKHCIAMSKLADPSEKQTTGLESVYDAPILLRTREGRREQYKCMADTTNREGWGILVPTVLEHARFDSMAWRVGMANRQWDGESHFKIKCIREYITEVVKYAHAGEIFEEREVSRKTFNGNDRYIDEWENWV